VARAPDANVSTDGAATSAAAAERKRRRVVWASAEIRGSISGALWLAGATPSQTKHASQGLRLQPKTTITTGMTDQSNPAGVDPGIRETDKTDPPSEARAWADAVNADPTSGCTATVVPVLPPGCRLEREDSGGRVVFQAYDRYGHESAWDYEPEGAAAGAWKAFGAFMSREDYEQHKADFQDLRKREATARAALEAEHDATHAAGLRAERAEEAEEALSRVDAAMKRMHTDRKVTTALMNACGEALDVAGVDRVADGCGLHLAERVRLLAAKASGSDASVAIAHDRLSEAGVERFTMALGEQGPAKRALTLVERVGLLASKVGDAQAGEAYGREVMEQEAERLRERVRVADALAASAETRTEAHRAEISRLTDTIQRLRAELAAFAGSYAATTTINGQRFRLLLVPEGPTAGEDPDHD
jgi:hypothetical protein